MSKSIDTFDKTDKCRDMQKLCIGVLDSAADDGSLLGSKLKVQLFNCVMHVGLTLMCLEVPLRVYFSSRD